MEQLPPLLLVDFDGTLVFTEERWNKCEEETKGKNKSEFWQCYQSPKYMYLDKPNFRVIEFVNKLAEKGVAVFILSGRMEDTQLQYSLMQLTTYNVRFNGVILRKRGDFSKDAVFKGKHATELMRSYNIILAIDDSKDVRDEFQKLGIRAISPDEI